MKTENSKSKSIHETRVDDALTDKPPSILPGDTVDTAAKRMREMQTPELMVAKEKVLLGTINQPDPDRAVARYGHDPKQTLVGDTMSKEVAFCFEDQSCAEALAIMEERNQQFLPVLNRDQRITGIVSRAELLAKFADKDARE